MQQTRIRFDFHNTLAQTIGDHGLTQQELTRVTDGMAAVHSAMEAQREQMAWRSLPRQSVGSLREIARQGAYIRSHFENFVVLGIGGSALGPKVIASACCHFRYNELPKEKRGGPRFYVEDNVDPDRLSALFDVIDPATTAFQIITKSGDTVETVAKLLVVIDLLQRRLGSDYRHHIFCTTDPQKGLLRRMAQENGFALTDVPVGVGGRFSVLCAVGLLTASVLGVDIPALLKGAADMDAACSLPDWEQNPAYLYAAIHAAAMEKGANIAVLMPYSEALAPLAEWQCQLWGESLGKRLDRDGNAVYRGQTQVRATGVVDQHSQIQLYNEGPFDKIITFLGVAQFAATVPIPQLSIPVYDASYLCGTTLNRLMETERLATAHALAENGRMNAAITVDRVDAYTLGALFQFFEMATAVTGELLNVNAFDQPGVEAGKSAAYALLGRRGYEMKARMLEKKLSAGDHLLTLDF